MAALPPRGPPRAAPRCHTSRCGPRAPPRPAAPPPPGSTDLKGANFEFAAPSKCYVVVNGEKTEIDLEKLPPLTPRQLNVIAGETSGLEAGISRCGPRAARRAPWGPQGPARTA